MIVLLVITDGRTEYLTQAVKSAKANLVGPITRQVMYDDTGDYAYREHLLERFPQFEHINGGQRQGFGGAIDTAWKHIADGAERFVFHLEQDFTFNRPVDLDAMAAVLDACPHVMQLALRRQPWNEDEREAGGIVEQHPDDYTERTDGHHVWLEHRRFFTTNPSLYRTDLLHGGWPTGDESEGHFSIQLFGDHRLCSAYWGSRDSGEAVEHIGHQRIGVGY